MFIGRDRELSKLKELLDKPTASLVVCKGRRRIGKSTLIQKFGLHADRFLEFQGLPPSEGASNEKQLESFAVQLSQQSELPELTFRHWPQVFSFLTSQIRKEKTILFFDEISWLASYDKNFAGHFKIAWDTQLKHHSNLVVVLCGSVTSWIENNILNNTGFVGRVSLEITLEELPLSLCSSFWGNKSSRVNAKEKLQVLMVTGGVPRYLEEIRPHRSAEDNIIELCFSSNGMLYKEFNAIFNDIFLKRSQIYKSIVSCLATGSKTFVQIAKETQMKRNGHLSHALDELGVSGFISKDICYSIETGKAGKKVRYRLKDNYLRFYLRYIDPLLDNIKKGLYEDAALSDIINMDSIFGLQFENLVLNNLKQVISLLGIRPANIISASPHYQNQTQRRKSCQVDLLIQTRQSSYICEIKFRQSIGTEVIESMKEKMSRLNLSSAKSIRYVLVHAGAVTSDLVKAQFFDHILNVEDWLDSKHV